MKLGVILGRCTKKIIVLYGLENPEMMLNEFFHSQGKK